MAQTTAAPARSPRPSRRDRPAHHQMSAGGKRLVGFLTALAAIVALALAFMPSLLPWNQQFQLKVQSSSFGQLDQHSWVEMGGTKIGEVTGLEGNDAVLDLAIDPRYARELHADASASIQPHGLLGPKYIELYPGTKGVYAAGATIPSSRVHVAVDFDQVVDALQPDVRQSLQVILIELGKGSQDRGADVNAALEALGQSASNLDKTTATLAGRDADISQVLIDSEQFDRDVQNAPIAQQIADTDTVLSGLAQVDQNIGDGVDQTAAVLEHLDVVMNGNQANLADVLGRLPADIVRLRTLLAAGNELLGGVNSVDTKDGYGYSSVEALMTAVLFTKSAFGGQDANGHFVRVYSGVSGQCSVGLPSLPLGSPGSGQCAGMPLGSSGQAAPVVPTSSLSDQQLIQLFLGS